MGVDLISLNDPFQLNNTTDIPLSLAPRAQCYHLIKIGDYLYPRSFTGLAHRLPLGLYAKECHRSPGNEIETLRQVEKYTSIPAPLWVDDYEGAHRILIMTAVPGQTLGSVFHRLSYPERKQFSKNLKDYVSQKRCVPNLTSYLFGNSLGGQLKDHRFPSGTCGPFDSGFYFNAFLVHRYVARRQRIRFAVHGRTYKSFITHADLHLSNIIIDRGRLAEIVD